MNVRVRFFAAAREAAGASTLDVDVPTGTTARGLVALLGARCGERLTRELTSVGMRIAVNRELIDDDAVLGHGDEVAFMPPVTGG